MSGPMMPKTPHASPGRSREGEFRARSFTGGGSQSAVHTSQSPAYLSRPSMSRRVKELFGGRKTENRKRSIAIAERPESSRTGPDAVVGTQGEFTIFSSTVQAASHSPPTYEDGARYRPRLRPFGTGVTSTSASSTCHNEHTNCYPCSPHECHLSPRSIQQAEGEIEERDRGGPGIGTRISTDPLMWQKR